MIRSDNPSARCVMMILAVLWTVSVKGQKINVAVFGGITVSQVAGDSYPGFNKLGVATGFLINRYIDHDIYWQAEMKYGTRGVYKGPTDADQTLYRSGYHIVELPLSVHYLYNEKLLVEIGTSPELLIKAIFWDENGRLDPASYPENRRFGLNVFAGLGYRIKPKLMAGVRYTNSAIPFRDPEEWNNAQYRGYFHNVLSLTMAFRIGQP